MKKKSERKKKGIIIAIFIAAFFMAIGYAALQATLTINAVGKIYSDWDVEFTDSTCDITSSYVAVNPDLAMECLATATVLDGLELDDHLDTYTGGIEDDGDSNVGSTGLGGIVLNLYTEFATPNDETEYEIEITNFSKMWDAVLMSIMQTPSSNETGSGAKTDWILYEFTGISADLASSDINPDTGNATVIAAHTGTPNTVTFNILASWNPDYENDVPTNAIKKDNETEADAATTSYTQTDEFVLLFEAYAPGTY